MHAQVRRWLLPLLSSLLMAGCFIVTDPPPRPDPPTDVLASDADTSFDGDGDIDLEPNDGDESDLSFDETMCVAQELRCEAGAPQPCGADGLSWEPGEVCEDDAVCNGGQCRQLPIGYERLCSDPMVPCPADLVCYQGRCLASHASAESGADCLTDSECDKTMFCNGLGVCSDGSGDCRADDDCLGDTPVCDPFGKECSGGGLGVQCIPGTGCLSRYLCGPRYTCQTGLDGSRCLDPQHCAPAAPICGPDDECQDG